MRLRRLAAFTSVALALLASRSDAGDPPPAPPASARVLEHDLHVRLIPSERRLIGEDRLLVDGGGSGGQVVLHNDRPLEWVGMPERADGKPLASAGTQGAAHRVRVDWAPAFAGVTKR